MSAQPYASRLSLLETFRSAVWGNKSILKRVSTLSGIHTIEYLDFAEHLPAVRSFCDAITDDKLAVFEEYRTAMDTFKKQDVVYKNGACIIGQPGIGKTCFTAYSVVERLREEQPVAVQISWGETHPEYLLFTSNAVSIHNGKQTDPLDHYPLVWAFSDSDDADSSPILAFFKTAKAQVRIFHTTSPAEHHWKAWTKKREVDLYTMDVPSMKEIKALAVILGKDMERAETLAHKWGLVPRIVLQVLEAPERELALEVAIVHAIDEATINPRFVFAAIAHYNSSSVQGLSTVFFIGPESKTHRDLPSVYVPTRWLTRQLVDGLLRHREDKRAHFFNTMNAHPRVRPPLGWMFEAVAHRFLTNEKDFTIHWCNGNTETLSLPPLQPCPAVSNLKNFNPSFYWHPPSSNYPGIDGAIATADGVFGIQATIESKYHSPTKGLKKLQKHISRDWSQWKVLLVSFRDDQAQAVSREFADGVKVTNTVHLPVGWLTVPLGRYGFPFLELALETAGAGTSNVGMARMA